MYNRLEILFLSEWHLSSGIGDGHLADAVLARDTDGLPYLPGRALKGALREGAKRLGLCRQDLARAEAYFWGTRSTTAESNQAGRIRLSPARLRTDIAAWLRQQSPTERTRFVQDMLTRRVQTALDEMRQVKSGSLRTLECGIAGMSFEAELEIDTPPELSEAWTQHYFAAVCAAVKSMGGQRARGLGHCRITFAEATQETVSLPPQQSFFMGGDA